MLMIIAFASHGLTPLLFSSSWKLRLRNRQTGPNINFFNSERTIDDDEFKERDRCSVLDTTNGLKSKNGPDFFFIRIFLALESDKIDRCAYCFLSLIIRLDRFSFICCQAHLSRSKKSHHGQSCQRTKENKIKTYQKKILFSVVMRFSCPLPHFGKPHLADRDGPRNWESIAIHPLQSPCSGGLRGIWSPTRLPPLIQ
jgi:hypothetical protein